WGAEKRLVIEPFGLDIIPELAELARRRLPQWADRIHVGNIRNWQPASQRFDFVLIRPEYSPAARAPEIIRHIVDKVLLPMGRLIVFVGTEETYFRRVESSLSSHGLNITGRS